MKFMKSDTTPAEKVMDPVCGMRFKPEKAAATVEYRGKTIHFCTKACRKQFERDPTLYVTRHPSR